jgi:hypothetical protein
MRKYELELFILPNVKGKLLYKAYCLSHQLMKVAQLAFVQILVQTKNLHERG